eukprot:7320130-Prymnesium_polylepis.1
MLLCDAAARAPAAPRIGRRRLAAARRRGRWARQALLGVPRSRGVHVVFSVFAHARCRSRSCTSRAADRVRSRACTE